MKGIYVLAMLAVLAVCIVPMADDSDGASDFQVVFLVDGEDYAIRYDDNIGDLPADPVKDGYNFDGWKYLGQIVDVATYDFPNGLNYVSASFSPLNPEPQPEPEPETDWNTVFCAVFLTCVVIGIIAYIAIDIRRNKP